MILICFTDTLAYITALEYDWMLLVYYSVWNWKLFLLI